MSRALNARASGRQGDGDGDGDAMNAGIDARHGEVIAMDLRDQSRDDAFRTQLEPHRRAIMLHAYRMLGSLQLLPAKQRAALLLVDVLGWRPGEMAALLKTTEASVNSLLQRARKKLDERPVEAAAPAGPDDAAAVQRFITAFESRDLDTFT